MRHTAPPTISANTTFTTCLASYQDPDVRTHLRSATALIVAAETAFVDAARAAAFDTIATADAVGAVTKAEMVSLYDGKLVQSKEGRKIYETIRGGPNERCPLCDHRGVETLDHYLDKALYPALAVTPANLVPSCFRCNREKMHHHPTTPERFTLHPYFDRLGIEAWLSATVERTSPPAVRFEIAGPAAWSALLAVRTKTHFQVLRLYHLFGTLAAQELQNLKWQLGEIFGRSGAAGVASHLTEAAESRRRANPNSWQTAMYAAIAGDAWFCDRGFDF